MRSKADETFDKTLKKIENIEIIKSAKLQKIENIEVILNLMNRSCEYTKFRVLFRVLNE